MPRRDRPNISTPAAPALPLRYGAVTARSVDPDFLALPRQALGDAALSAALGAGASYADLRVHRIATEIVQLRDGELESAVTSRDVGLAVRVIVDGTWGFASHAELSPDVAADTARRARVATTLAPLNAERIELADEPVYRDAAWVSSYLVDPFAVPSADKIALLTERSARLLASEGVDHVSASLLPRSRSRSSTQTPTDRPSPSSACE